MPIARKRRTREHVIADLSVNHVERFALLCGFSVERVRFDYGIDLIVHTYNRQGEIENGRILFQLKASDRLRLSQDGSTVQCRLARADLNYWLGETMPVILIQYDARNDRAYWIHIQGHCQGMLTFHMGNNLTLSIPHENLLDRRSMKHFARKKTLILAQQRKGNPDGD